MESFRARLFGRHDDRRLGYETRARLNIRTGPGTEHDALPEGLPPEGTRVTIDGQHSVWRLVTLSDPANGLDVDVEGWMHGLRRTV